MIVIRPSHRKEGFTIPSKVSLEFSLTSVYLCACVKDSTMAANFDITPLMAPYLDVHMISPMLDFLREVLFACRPDLLQLHPNVDLFYFVFS